jgi:hypothetical protein
MTQILQDAAAKVIEPVEDILDSFGLMRGSNAPIKRFVITAGLTGLVMWAVKPTWAFQAEEPRPWSFMVGPNAREGPQPTATPWWVVPVGVGMVFSFLI